MEKVLILFLVFRVSTTVSDVCSNDSNGKCNSFEGHDRYSKDKRWQHLLQTIEESIQKYSPCDLNCRCHNEQVIKDLAPWKEDGISWSALQEAKPYGTYYQIINHTIYREDNCMFPFRCYGVEYFLNKIAKKIPDVEFILNTRDWPQVSRFRKPIPVFSFSKTSSYLDIMYPAWSFWEGGPALGIYPTGLGRWDKQRELIKKAAEEWLWEKKKSLAFFRGSRTSPERDRLVLLSRTNPNLVDAQYTKNQAWKSDADTLNMPPAEEVKLEDHCQYKYLFNFRGVAASFRFKHLFLCKSLVFHVEDEWLEFFYPSIKPWVHYIPVPPGATEQELESIIQFAADNDKVAQQIAERGFEFIWNQLRIKDIRCYWTKLLKSYATLQKFKPERQKTLKLVLPRER